MSIKHLQSEVRSVHAHCEEVFSYTHIEIPVMMYAMHATPVIIHNERLKGATKDA
jgi:hypothetical protein